MEFDLHNNIDDRLALSSRTIGTNTTTVGTIIDTQGYQSLEYIVTSGTITDGAYAFLLEEGDASNLSDAAVVPADETLGALTGFVAAEDDVTKRVGSIGKKRYQRLSLVSTGTTTGGVFSASAIMGNARSAPVAQ